MTLKLAFLPPFDRQNLNSAREPAAENARHPLQSSAVHADWRSGALTAARLDTQHSPQAREQEHPLDTTRVAYLFQCEGEDLFAVTCDKSGGNIPRSTCSQGWKLCEEFVLGASASVPAPILPGPILRGILTQGYYVWRGWSGPTGRPAGPEAGPVQ